MAADGTPERATQLCGHEIARLRVQRGWSRAKLIAHLYRELDPEDVTLSIIGEAWLARLENGRMVKVSRGVIEALCRALKCTPRERVRVLMYADRNVLTDVSTDAPDPVAELLTMAMERLVREARELVTTMLGQRQTAQLTESEILDIAAVALHLTITGQAGCGTGVTTASTASHALLMLSSHSNSTIADHTLDRTDGEDTNRASS